MASAARNPRVPALSIATPALEVIDVGVVGKVLGAGTKSAFVGAGDFVLALTHNRTPLLPNGITVPIPLAGMLSHGEPVSLSPARIETRGLIVELGDATLWHPQVTLSCECTRDHVFRRGLNILEACGGSAEPAVISLAGEVDNRLRSRGQSGLRAGLEGLFDALTRRDATLASSAARRLAGRGPGLTPEGDDLLSAVAGAVAVFGPAVGFDGRERQGWLDAVGAERDRMTALSATLMGLALRGMVMAPAGLVMDPTTGRDGWLAGLRRLTAIGHGTGLAYALAIGAAAALLGARALVH